MRQAKKTIFLTILLFVCLLFLSKSGIACSTYKVTVNGSTMMGINYDTWFLYPRIWFETNKYGAVFSGANNQGADGFAPQSGMNVRGLSFSTLATMTPRNGKSSPEKQQIKSRALFLKEVLHSCKNVQEVKTFLERYDHSFFSNDVFLYTDRSGNYLIVEPYSLTLGTDPKYVLANFCPSTITDFSTIKQKRYVDGAAFLKNKIDTSLAFCNALSDTMHVCREKIGDGTLLTSIYDLNRTIVHLYFYHDYSNTVQFDLEEELKKGNHVYEIPALFPPNAEYQKLVAFKTPMNSAAINVFLRVSLLFFAATGLIFLISYLRFRKTTYAIYKLVYALLSFVLAYYVVSLATNMNLFYFPAPYQETPFSLLNIVSYLPFLSLLLMIPSLILNKKLFQEKLWSPFTRWLLSLHNLFHLILLILFMYWGLFNVFG